MVEHLVSDDILVPLKDPEIFFGIVCAVGTDKDVLIQRLEAELSKYEYECVRIKLSSLLHQLPEFSHLATPAADERVEDKRISAHMDAGDKLRESLCRGDALALLSIAAIRNERESKSGNSNDPIPRRAYILDSLKHPEEIETLRRVYGRALNIISLYSPKSARITTLSHKIARSHKDSEADKYRATATALIERDAEEPENLLGQNVRQAFPKADLFVSEFSNAKIESELRRFLATYFGFPFHTPTVDEWGMFHAFATAFNSADLSRQVGAVIATARGQIIATGYNEVPKPGGGFYRDGDDPDHRDFKEGRDASARMKEEMVAELVARFLKHDLFNDDLKKRNIDEIIKNLLYGDDKNILSGTRVLNLLEFGRILHAEMAALIDATTRRVSVINTTMYCTTFPCHMCCRHIIAAGIDRVVYIEPYPKSAAKELYSSMIDMDDASSSTLDEGAVKFDAFMGIAPRRYTLLFDKTKRKDATGRIVDWKPQSSGPRISWLAQTYLEVETTVVAKLAEKLGNMSLN